MRRMTGKTITGEVPMVLVWKRLKEIEDVLGDDYDLERLKQLLTGDNFTQEDMSAAYTSGFEIGRKEREDKTCAPCPAIHAVKAMAASDLQPVVRCKDCKHFETELDHPYGPWCNWHHFDAAYNDFCNYGERRRADGKD